MFESVRYGTKTTPELRAALERKVRATVALLEERDVRIRLLREEYQIDPERLADLVIQFKKNDRASYVTYTPATGAGQPRDEVVVPAGVVANIVREKEMTDSERAQIRKMELVLRNLRDEERYVDPDTGAVKTRECLHELTDEELEYLGF
jgi:hypothetical protein